ncbi:hypothetical protein Bca101_032496 [Brassica carinata]
MGHYLCDYCFIPDTTKWSTHCLIKPERGIRKGEPLIPFLFIICTEALVNFLNVVEKKRKLHEIRLSTEGAAWHHWTAMLLCYKVCYEHSGYLNSLPKPARTLVASWDLGDDVLYTSTSASRYQRPLS